MTYSFCLFRGPKSFKAKRHKELVTPVVTILDTPPTLILNLGILTPDDIRDVWTLNDCHYEQVFH